MRRRFVNVFMPIPTNPDTIPKKGDRLRYVDDLGRTVTYPIAKVDSPENAGNHLEIESERFE
jgi:hypothetical protein